MACGMLLNYMPFTLHVSWFAPRTWWTMAWPCYPSVQWPLQGNCLWPVLNMHQLHSMPLDQKAGRCGHNLPWMSWHACNLVWLVFHPKALQCFSDKPWKSPLFLLAFPHVAKSTRRVETRSTICQAWVKLQAWTKKSCVRPDTYVGMCTSSIINTYSPYWDRIFLYFCMYDIYIL